ncbi:hypothetical protein [Halostella salina]|uniref:hypothetical protein n=1 Tax=Halostella salina TaxID=1547897 RepID=UPI0013CEF782|nr:hypothetical protein [Halostella salina]
MSGDATMADERDPETVTDRDPVVATDPDPAAAADRVRRRAEAIRREEVAAALRRLEAAGELTDGQRRAVVRMSERITGTLVDAPTEALRSAEDDDAVATALDLFGDGSG